MVPETIRKPWFIVPLCIFSLALGQLLLFFLVFPDTYPDVHERIMLRHFVPLVLTLGTLCVSLPILLLFLATREECEL